MEERVRQALGLKPDYAESYHILADLEMQRAKLAAGFHAPLPRCLNSLGTWHDKLPSRC